MVRIYKELSSCRPSASADAYILNILPLFNESLAVLTSADEILLLSSRILNSAQISRIADPGKGLTCTAIDQTGRLVFSAGTDNLVSVFDIRSGHRASTLSIGKPATALACRGNDVAVGTALDQKQHQADLAVWDLRQQKIRWQNNENNDDITAVTFHPSKPHILLAGGDDGLVSLFDTTIQEEGDSLVQAFNHGPIHKAGFVDQTAIYALSADQNLAIHPMFEDQRETEPSPVLLGDMRPLVPCEYVIDLVHAADEFLLATGSHSKSQVDLVNMIDGHSPDVQNKTVLQNAHGNEIVRAIFIDTASARTTVFTGGEDGCVKAWQPGDAQTLGGSVDTGIDKKSKPSKGSRPGKLSSVDARYKPY